jgi:hypothetical protein
MAQPIMQKQICTKNRFIKGGRVLFCQFNALFELLPQAYFHFLVILALRPAQIPTMPSYLVRLPFLTRLKAI